MKKYDIWNGKKVIGSYESNDILQGKSLTIMYNSRVNLKSKTLYLGTIEIPIITRLVHDDGVEYLVRRCLDVRKKSKRQIKIILAAS